jgi:hypothetical protein
MSARPEGGAAAGAKARQEPLTLVDESEPGPRFAGPAQTISDA